MSTTGSPARMCRTQAAHVERGGDGADVALCWGAGAVWRERPELWQGLHDALHQRAVANGGVSEFWLDLQPLW